MKFTHDQLVKFKELVYNRCHLTFPGSREQKFRRCLTQRAKEGAYRSLDEYYHAVSSDVREFERLVSLITTRETFFFRIPGQFEVLREVVLPEIVVREGRMSMQALSRGEPHLMKLRAWSAGCATGQETYSLSMQILDTFRYPKAWDIQALGTDINADALDIAGTGRYGATRLGSVPARFLERYFSPLSPDEVVVSNEVKAITKFQVMNLRNLPRQESFKNAFDIIFCRNVMIYFDLPAQQQLITDLSACLKPGGYLFTGEGEVLHLYCHEFEVKEKGGCIFYRKPGK